MVMIPSLNSLSISLYTPKGENCEMYPLAKDNMVELNFNIPYLNIIY